jgi:hypothetical protein
MTWAEFKESVEKQGVKSDDLVVYIDIHGDDHRLRVTRAPDPDQEGHYWFYVS